jgi:hypothetical protein
MPPKLAQKDTTFRLLCARRNKARPVGPSDSTVISGETLAHGAEPELGGKNQGFFTAFGLVFVSKMAIG